jgi:hypothetical protein
MAMRRSKTPVTTGTNILKVPVTEMTITKEVKISKEIKMVMGIKITETTGIEMVDGKGIDMSIHATMKEGMKNILIETITGDGFLIIGATGGERLIWYPA